MFLYDLARELHMTLGDLLDRADAAELTGWAAYFRADRERTERARMEAEVEAGARAGVQEAFGRS